MKVTLVFCLLAIYGAVADDATGTTGIDTSSSWSIGGGLQLVNDLAQAGIAAKQNVVEKGVGVLTTSITEATKLGAQAIGDGTAIAQSAIDMGKNLASEGMNAANNINSGVMGVLEALPGSKYLPTNTMKEMFGKAMALGGKGVTGFASAGKYGVNVGEQFGKNMMEGIGNVVTNVNGAIVAGDQKMNAISSNAVTASVNKVSAGLMGFGNRLMNFGSRFSNSASMNTASTGTTASVPSTP